MPYRPDFIVSDRSGQPVAIVQVRTLRDADAQTATTYMHTLLEHGLVPNVRFVLLIAGETGYLWSSLEAVHRKSLPTLNFPMDRIARHYLPSDDGASPVDEIVLDAIVRVWLDDLVDEIAPDDPAMDSLRQLGLLDAIRDGRVNAHATV